MQATQNKIVNYDTVNQLGIKRTKPVNVNGVYNFNSNISYSMPVRFLKGTIELSSNTGYFKGKQFINTVPNNIKTLMLGPEIRLDMNPAEKLNISVGATLNYNKTKYSLQSALNTNYLSQEYSASLDWQMPKGFFFVIGFHLYYQQPAGSGFQYQSAVMECQHQQTGAEIQPGRNKIQRC